MIKFALVSKNLTRNSNIIKSVKFWCKCVKLLWDIFKVVNSTSLHIGMGKTVILLRLRSNFDNLDKFPISSGNLVKQLSCNWKRKFLLNENFFKIEVIYMLTI